MTDKTAWIATADRLASTLRQNGVGGEAYNKALSVFKDMVAADADAWYLRQAYGIEAENVCEHGDHPAPAGVRYCSVACAECEALQPPVGQDCAGRCGIKEASPNVP